MLCTLAGNGCYGWYSPSSLFVINLSSALAKDLRARWAPVGRYALAAASCTHLPEVFGGYTHETSNSRYSRCVVTQIRCRLNPL